MSSDRKLTDKQQHVQDIITSHNAVIAIVFDTKQKNSGQHFIDYAEIDELYLNQISNPTKNRPSRAADFFNNISLPQYDILLISLSGSTKIPDELIQKAQTENFPIIIRRDTDSYAMYNFNYYREIQWQEIPLTDLDGGYLYILKRFSFGGEFLEKEDGFPTNDGSLSDVQQVFIMTSHYHSYLPFVVNKMNMQTLKIHQHHPGKNRVTKHNGIEYDFTAKTSTSLIPPDPRFMELFFCDSGIGFLWDINNCNSKKGKYVYAVDGVTEDCGWINLNSGYAFDGQEGKIKFITAEEKIANFKEQIKKLEVCSIASLRERNLAAIKNKTTLMWNELLVGLPKGIIQAVFATQDKRAARLRALRGMLHTKEILNLSEDLPLFILQPFYAGDTGEQNRPAVFRFYSIDEQQVDLAAEKVDEQIANSALTTIKIQNALAVVISNESMIDQYLQNPTQADTALLPSDPQWMNLSEDDQAVVGLLWDSDTCDIDENSRATIAGLKEKNNEAVNHQTVITRNHLLATPPANQVSAIFCYDNGDIYSPAHFQMLDFAKYIKEKLKLNYNIPIFVISIEYGCRLYTDLDQLLNGISSPVIPHKFPKVYSANQNSSQVFFKPAAPVLEEDPEWINVTAKDCELESDKDRQKCIFM